MAFFIDGNTYFQLIFDTTIQYVAAIFLLWLHLLYFNLDLKTV